MELNLKIVAGLERFGEVFKTLLWEKAKVHGISPIQIQILLFISSHSTDLSNVSYLAKEFNLTKPTISDAIRVLLNKEFIEKDFSPTDNRRFNLLLSAKGQALVKTLNDYRLPILNEIETINPTELNQLFGSISKLIYQLNKIGLIQVQRTCFGCQYYKGNQKDSHFCNLLNQKLVDHEIKLDCPDFIKK